MNERLCRPLLDAARATGVVATGERGLWTIAHHTIPADVPFFARYMGPYRTQTALRRATLATLHTEKGGDVVMEDSQYELARHLPAMLAAEGRCLVSGLGLGCVVRGMLANGRVTHIDVIENDAHMLALVGPTLDAEPRVTIHHADARTFPLAGRDRWDFAWHDVWDEHEALDLVHARILARFAPHVRRQGAWQFDRSCKTRWPRLLVGASHRSWLRAMQRTAA